MFSLPDIEHKFTDYEPVIDAKTMEIHYQKHHQAYVDNLNVALEKLEAAAPDFFSQIKQIFAQGSQSAALEFLLKNLSQIPTELFSAINNNAGGHANHSFFWRELTADKTEPSSVFLAAIEQKFGSLDQLKAQFKQTALGRFGSGWAWLVKDPQGELEIISTANQDSPLSVGLIPIFGLDVWEHAYYLNYQNRRGDYIDGFWQILNWQFASENYER